MSDTRWSDLYPQDVDARKRGELKRPAPEIRKPINVVLPTWKGDEHQAIWLLEWLSELGFTQAPFYLACSRDCKVQHMLELARKSFSRVEYIVDGENMVSNWHEPGHHPKSAAGPNSLFRQIAWHFSLQKSGPWLFLEPDAIPCRKDWYDVISREYEVGGRPFMGFHVTPQNHSGVPQHLSGVAVYPENTPGLAPKAVEVSEVAFDIAGVDNILPNSHKTTLIHHHYRAPSFTNEDDFNTRCPVGLAIFHANKDNSLIPFLRKRLGMTHANIPRPISASAPVIPLTPSVFDSGIWEFRNGQLVETV